MNFTKICEIALRTSHELTKNNAALAFLICSQCDFAYSHFSIIIMAASDHSIRVADFGIWIADESIRTKIYVNQSTKIKEVKEKLIQQKRLKEDGSTFSLFKDNNKLEDDANIQSCNIRKGDVLLKSTDSKTEYKTCIEWFIYHCLFIQN